MKCELRFLALRCLVQAVVKGQATVVAYLNMLQGLQEDDGRFLGFMRAPAAKRNHHAFEGGLVDHLVEMWDYWTMIRGATVAEGDLELTDSRVVQAILLHDLEKADHCFKLVSEDPWTVEYADTVKRKLVSVGDLRSLVIATRYGVQVDDELINTLFWSHGGFSEVQMKARTSLAKLIYVLDELSGGIKDPVRRGDYLQLGTSAQKRRE